MYGVYIVYRPTLLVFKSDRIVVGMVFGGGGMGMLGKKWARNKIICFHSKTVLLVFKMVLKNSMTFEFIVYLFKVQY